MRFNTQYDRQRQKIVPLDNTRLVEDYGYISPQERIKQLVLAGERLRLSRAMEYDTLDEAAIGDANDSLPNVIYKPDLYDGQSLLAARAARAALRRERVNSQAPKTPEVTPETLAADALEVQPENKAV